MATAAQIVANRQNALKSTGPVTEDGKRMASRNSLVHGLAGKGIVMPEYLEEEADERAGALYSSLKPWNYFEEWLTESIGRDMVRVEDAAKQQMLRRCHFAWRAQQSWDDDRRSEALALVEDLARRPTAVSDQLRQSPQGCALLIEYWTDLAAAPDWDDARRSFALDLLGVPRALRSGPTRIDPPVGTDAAEHRRALARREIERLTERAAPGGAVAHYDEQQQFEATAGLCDTDPTLKLLRRYESECSRRIARHKAMFGDHRRGESYVKRSGPNGEPTEEERIREEELFEQERKARRARMRSRLDPFPPADPAPIPACVTEPSAEALEVEGEPLPALESVFTIATEEAFPAPA